MLRHRPRRLFLASATVLAGSLFCIRLPAETVLRTLGGGRQGWEGWAAIGPAWGITDRPRANDPSPDRPHMESLAGGETSIGVLRSPVFTIAGDLLRLTVNGWDGRGGGNGVNGFLLRRAADGALLRRAAPPLQDGFQACNWLVSDLRGQAVYLEAVDGNTQGAFAWLGLARVEEVRKEVPADRSPYRVISLPVTMGTWSLLRYDGARRPTPPYLSSLRGGERGTGRIRSPAFALSGPRVLLLARGWDGPRGERGLNRIELVNAETGAVQRSSPPPLNDFPQPIEWQVTDLQGLRAYVRLIDGDSGDGYAWLGLDEVDAGESFRARFADPASLEGWQVEGSEPIYVERDGIPFLAATGSPVPEGGSLRLPLDVRARRLFLLGMTNSLDQGCPVWGDPNDAASRFFVGERLGTLRLEYADGTTEDYPLVLGESLWWGRLFRDAPEPFVSDAKAKAVLAETLRLYPPRPVADGLYLAVIEARRNPIRAMEVVDRPDKAGVPAVVGVTVEPEPGEKVPGGRAFAHDHLARKVVSFLNTQRLLPSRQEERVRRQALARLRSALYVTEQHLAGGRALAMPPGYRGPRLRFRGNVDADILTNVFHHNVHDMAGKVDEAGMYHTSSRDAPSWGGYQGFGTFTKAHGAYYSHSWSRDMGRALQELVTLGYLEQGRRCADYCFRMARRWPAGFPTLNLKGERVPAHWSRIVNLPELGEGCLENDGHGLTALFLYRLWQRLPDREAWLRPRWLDVKAAGDWVVWQLENPALSGATKVLLTDSECAGGIGHSVYADFACMEALRGLAEMAASIGQSESADRWQATAERLQHGIEESYVVEEPRYGRTWTLASSGWPNRSTVLGPLILLADRRGMAPEEDDPSWRPLNEAAYLRLVESYRPFGFYGVAMGYGQGFVTQAALLLDRMREAGAMLAWAARAIYDPRYQPFIVPEGCEVEPMGRFWHRTGDLGNGVQQAEIVKVLRLIVGIDDSHPGRLRLFPRMPYGWTEISVKDHPACIERAGQRHLARLRYTLRRGRGEMSLTAACDRAWGPFEVRLGPFETQPDPAAIRLNRRSAHAQVERSGDSWWVKVVPPPGGNRLQVSVVTNAE